MKKRLYTAMLLSLLAAGPAGDGASYSNDFSKTPVGKPPEDQFLVLAGEFAVKDVEGGRVLELAGTPLDSYGALFGPTLPAPATTVSARVWGATTGRRFPEFGVGSNDAGGFKLWLGPRQKRVFIRKGDEVVATAAYESWQTETWTNLQLQVSKADAGWVVRGKVWPGGAEEPKAWTISHDEPEEPAPGRASVWGNPYSGKAIRFDDLKVGK